jgi:hypothetical protein
VDLTYKHLALLSFLAWLNLAKAQELKVFAYRAPVTLGAEGRSLRLARDRTIKNGQSFVVGAKGGLVIESKLGSEVSIIGPAMLRWIDQCLVLDWGEVLIEAARRETICLKFDQHTLNIRRRKIGIEKHPTSGVLKIFNLADASLTVGEHPLTAFDSLFISQSGVRVEPHSPLDYESFVERHRRNRQNEGSLDEVTAKVAPEDDPNLNSFFEISTFLGVFKHLPLSGTFVQRRGAFAFSARMGRDVYMSMPDRPTRLDYLNRFHFRLGFELAFLGGTLEPAVGVAARTLAATPAFFGGISTQGLFIDLGLGYPLELSSSAKRLASLSVPAMASLTIAYRFDLVKIVESELGLMLAARSFFIYRQNINNPAVSPSSSMRVPIGLQGTLSFLF